MNACHCRSLPNLGKNSNGCWVAFCSYCKHRSEPSQSKETAAKLWERSLCSVLCLGCAGYPVLKFIVSEDRWFMRCSHCIFKTGGYLSASGAISGWIRLNRPGSALHLELWNRKLEAIEVSRGVAS